MERFNKQRLNNIQAIFQEKTGVDVTVHRKNVTHEGGLWQKLADRMPDGARYKGRMAAVAGALLCVLTLSAFSTAGFSDIAGDEVGFSPIYKGDGIFEITVTNASNRSLVLQEDIKLMRWSTAEEVAGDVQKVHFENLKIAANSKEKVVIDLSEGYDIAALEEPLPAGDWYYLVLTNNSFAFGQDWMCSVDFEENVETNSEKFLTEELGKTQVGNATAENSGKENAGADSTANNVKVQETIYNPCLKFENWAWPTVSTQVSSAFGEQFNGAVSDHINIAGNEGDEVYAVADGTVTETGFDSAWGNYVVLDLGEGITVKYGHLQEILAEQGEKTEQGKVIAQLGKSGMATGPNLAFAVYEDGEAVNPLVE